MEAEVLRAVPGSGVAPAYMFTHNLHPDLFGWPPGVWESMASIPDAS